MARPHCGRAKADRVSDDRRTEQPNGTPTVRSCSHCWADRVGGRRVKPGHGPTNRDTRHRALRARIHHRAIDHKRAMGCSTCGRRLGASLGLGCGRGVQSAERSVDRGQRPRHREGLGACPRGRQVERHRENNQDQQSIPEPSGHSQAVPIFWADTALSVAAKANRVKIPI